MDEKLDEIFRAAKRACKENKNAAAVELFASYLKYRPEDVAALLLYGASLQYIGLRTKAEHVYKKALELSPQKMAYYIKAQLGTVFYDCGDTQKAEYWFSRACRAKEGKNLGWLWIYRGCNYSRMRKLKNAEKCFFAATKMDNSDVDEAFYNLGNIYRAQRLYSKARSAYRKALKIDPNYNNAKEALSSLQDINNAIKKS